MVIPREPTPLPTEQRPREEFSPDELRQLVRNLKVCHAKEDGFYKRLGKWCFRQSRLGG
jgi:hypothetical protein